MTRRPTSQSTPSSASPSLTQPRAEVERRIKERIELGRQLQARQLRNPDKYYREAAKWSEYNEELLKIVFTTESVYEKYASGYGGLLPDNDAQALHFRRMTVDDDIAKLESIIERLELYPEPPVQSVSEEVRPPQQAHDSSKVFVVHGHDEAALQAVARFLEKLRLKAIIRREQPDQGRTIIEKFEHCANEVGFAVVLLTPDDLIQAGAAPNNASRARQNVIFELGYFAGKLGRGRACLLRKGDVEIPSDLYGVIYTEMDAADGWKKACNRAQGGKLGL